MFARFAFAVLILSAAAAGCRRSNPAYHGTTDAGDGRQDGATNDATTGDAAEAPDGLEGPRPDTPVPDAPPGDGAVDAAPDLPVDPGKEPPPPDLPPEPPKEPPKEPMPDPPPDAPAGEGPDLARPCSADMECGADFCNGGFCEATPRFFEPGPLPLVGGASLCPSGEQPAFPAVAPDGSEIVYTCVNIADGDFDLYATLFDEAAGKWKTGAKLTGPGLASSDILPSQLSPDRKTLYYAKGVMAGSGTRDLFEATRAAPGDVTFGPEKLIPGIQSGEEDNALWMRPDRLFVYVSSRRKDSDPACGKVDTDIYQMSTGSPGGTFGSTSLVMPPSSSSTYDSRPSLPDHQRFMLFYRADSDCPGEPSHDIYLTWRDTPFAAWGSPALSKELNVDGASDLWPSVTADGRIVAYATHRSGKWEIWIANR